MKPEDIERFATTIGELCVAFNRGADEALINVYSKVLHDKRIEDIEAAATKYMNGAGDYMPTPGQLRKAALAAASKRNGVAFIEGTGWVSLTGNPEHADHPDTLDRRAELLLGPSGHAEPKRIATAKPGGNGDARKYIESLADAKHWSETGGDDDAA